MTVPTTKPPPRRRSRSLSSAASTPTLAALPYDALLCVCTHIDGLAELSRMARTSTAFHTLIKREPSCWERVTLPASALTAYLQQSPHTAAARSLHVRLPERATHRPFFCKHEPARANRLEFMPSLVGRCGSVLDAGVAEIVEHCPNLVELQLPGSGHLTSAALATALVRLEHIETLGLRGCDGVTVGFAAAAERSGFSLAGSKLRHVSLSHCSQAVDEDTCALLRTLPSLESLELDFCPALGDAVLEALPPKVEALSVLGCPRMSFDRLQALGKTLGPRLTSDDTAVFQAFACSTCDDCSGSAEQRGVSLMEMLSWYAEEEARWAR